MSCKNEYLKEMKNAYEDMMSYVGWGGLAQQHGDRMIRAAKRLSEHLLGLQIADQGKGEMIESLKAELSKLKDGYKGALELVETAKKEKDEIQENLRRRNAEVTRLKHNLSMGLPIIEYESYLSPEDKEKIKEMLSNTKPGVVFEINDKIKTVLIHQEETATKNVCSVCKHLRGPNDAKKFEGGQEESD